MTDNRITNHKESFIKSIFKFSISTWVNFIISFLAVIVTTRVFKPEIYGIVNIFNTTSATITTIMCLGLDSSYIRFYNEPPEKNNNRQLAFKLISIVTFLTVFTGFIVTTFFYQSFTRIIFGRSSWFISIMVFVSVLSYLLIRFFNISYRMSFNARQYTIQSILVIFVTKLFVVIAAFVNPTAEVVIAFNVVGVFILTVVYSFVQRKDIIPDKVDFNIRGYKPVFKYAIFTAPLSLGVNLNTFLSQQIIAQIISLAAVGIYSSASYFSTILTVLQGGFGTYWSAFMFSSYKKEQERIINMHDFIMFLLLVAFLGMVALKDPIYLLIGASYHESKSFFALVLIYPILSIATETTSYGMSIKNKNHVTLVNYIIAIVANLLISLLLTKQFGLKGAATASCISGIVMFALNTYWGQKYYKSIRDIKKTILCVILIVAIAGVTSLIENTIIVAISMIVIMAAAVVLYLPQIRVLIPIALKIADIRNHNK